MILSHQSIMNRCRSSKWPMIYPYSERRTAFGMTYGCGPAGYDIRISERHFMHSKRKPFELASSIEQFIMPNDVMAQVCDKSTWARKGLFVQNTIIEPGWRGYLTLELTYHGRGRIELAAGMPIAQIVFMKLDSSTDAPYQGKYQDQKAGPQEAIT